MKLINSNLLRSTLTLALLGGGILSTTPEAKAQQTLIESDRLLEYPYRWTGVAPRSETECVQGAAQELLGRINHMSNISEFETFSGSSVTRSLSNKFESVGKLIRNTTTFEDGRSSSAGSVAAQRGLVVSVFPKGFKPGSFGKVSEKKWDGARSSRCWGTLQYEFVVYGPNTVTALTSSNSSPADNRAKTNWRKISGSANDIAVDWVIGTNPEKGGYGIYRWNGSDWQKMPGSAVRIGGNSKNPWVVNKFNEIFRWTGSDWQKMPGSAHDVADGWVIGTNPEKGGYGIYRWNGSGWNKMPGSAVRIGGNSKNPWVVNKFNEIFRWTGSGWQKMPGSAHDVGSGWVIGTNQEAGGYGIYRWNGSDWDRMPGSAIHIGDSGDKPWVVNKQKHIFKQ